MSSAPDLSPECRLVFRTADPALRASEAAALGAEVRNWPRVVRLAEGELAAAVVWPVLQAASVSVPAPVAEHFRRRTMAGMLRMQHLSRRAQQTTALLASREIPFLLLKGAALGAMVDPTFRSRPMSDLDILVRGEDTARAAAAVVDAGWPQTTDEVVHALLEKQHHLPPFLDPHIPGMRLELHTSLLPSDQPFAIGEEEFWRDARPAPAPFAGALLPSPEHLLLHACVHFAWQHSMMFGAWRTFRVIAVVTALPGFDWEGVVARARSGKAATACYWSLRLAARLAGIAVPEAVLARLAPPTPEWLRGAIERHFVAALAPGEGPVSPSVQVSRLLWRAALRPRWSGHRSYVRWDPEHKWERALGTVVPESAVARLQRHLSRSRDWWEFLTRTLLDR